MIEKTQIKHRVYIDWLKERGLPPMPFVPESESDKHAEKVPNIIIKHAKKKTFKLLFIKIYKNKMLSNKEREIFLKILQAINIPPSQIMLIGIKDVEHDSIVDFCRLKLKTYEIKCAVLLGKEILKTFYRDLSTENFGKWTPKPPIQIPIFATWNLNELIEDPFRKKQAWEHYQKIMSYLNHPSHNSLPV